MKGSLHVLNFVTSDGVVHHAVKLEGSHAGLVSLLCAFPDPATFLECIAPLADREVTCMACVAIEVGA